ncbi:hypothetical protein DFH07DRAFT_771788 [Mycena maculata]|uniref:Cyanovirin-N domain-containing protein n=1 Tax=Mycena maculata TaxID=230809 RepID=A0AAD7NHA4_9AGAR|nr:hypothetical protein DFH07DRAFT_771788 [Mycena maculata]
MNNLLFSVFLALFAMAAVPSALATPLKKRDSVAAVCSDFVFDNPPDLTATCFAPDGSDSISDIDLDTCVGNNNGDLVVGTDFTASCTGLSLNGLELHAECASNGGGFTVNDPISLDTALVAHNGVLFCAGQ